MKNLCLVDLDLLELDLVLLVLCTANCRKHCRVCQVCLYITAVTTVNEIFASLPAST